MSEHLSNADPLDVFAGEVIEVVRSAHPEIVDQWDAEIRQAMADDEPLEDWPDYHTLVGAKYWLRSEIQIAQSFMKPNEPDSYAREQDVVDTCQAALLLFDYFEHPQHGN